MCCQKAKLLLETMASELLSKVVGNSLRALDQGLRNKLRIQVMGNDRINYVFDFVIEHKK